MMQCTIFLKKYSDNWFSIHDQPVQWQHIGELVIHIGVTREKTNELWWHFIIRILFSVLSWPHFLHAEEKYQEAVEGLNPDPNSHGFWFDIQQVTGTTLQAKVIYFSSPFSSMFQPPGEDPDQHEREEAGDVWRAELHQRHPHPHTLVWRRHWWTRWPTESSWSLSFNANFGCIVFI